MLMSSRLQARQIGLDQALALARRYNPDLSAVRDELIVAKGELQKASYLSPFNLEAAAEGDYRMRATRSNSQDWRIGFIQEFEIFGQRALRRRSAHLGYEAAAAQWQDRSRLLEGATKLTFYDALRARDNVALLSELSKLDQHLLEAARERLQAGEINQIEYNSSQIRYGQSHRAYRQGLEEYRLKRSSLGRLLGGRAGPEPEPAGDLALKLEEVKLETLLANALKTRPDLRARQLQVARSETEIALNRALNLPNPAIGMFVGHENNTERFVGPMFGLSIPLFNRRVGEATIAAGRSAQARDQLRATQLDIEQQVRDAYHRYLTALAALRIYEDEVVMPARESFGLLEAAFTAGKIDLIRLSVAEREAFQARANYINARFDVMAAQVAIELATATPIGLMK